MKKNGFFGYENKLLVLLSFILGFVFLTAMHSPIWFLFSTGNLN